MELRAFLYFYIQLYIFWNVKRDLYQLTHSISVASQLQAAPEHQTE